MSRSLLFVGLLGALAPGGIALAAAGAAGAGAADAKGGSAQADLETAGGAAGAAGGAAKAGEAVEAGKAQDAAENKAVDPNSDIPPPSTYDRKKKEGHPPGEEGEGEEDRSLLGQMARTLFGLAVVVGLIYLFGKLAMTRLGRGFRMPGQGGKTVTVQERVALDPKHALYVVSVRDGPTMLLGTGDGGVQLLTILDMSNENVTPIASFKEAMGKTSQEPAKAEATGEND